MIVQRMFFLPKVTPSPKSEAVCIRTALKISSSESEYFETILTPEEADDLALDLMLDARRARARIASMEWLERSKKG